jgi:putative transposase
MRFSGLPRHFVPGRDKVMEMTTNIIQWPHAPDHIAAGPGTYMITAATYNGIHYFSSPEILDLVLEYLFQFCNEFGWALQAWAILLNHYHFIAVSTENSGPLEALLRKFHGVTSTKINRLQGAAGRKIWHQYWDSKITYQKSYMARLNYVNNNPAKHGLVTQASLYPWCSSAWFERTADRSFVITVAAFKYDRLKIKDDF